MVILEIDPPYLVTLIMSKAMKLPKFTTCVLDLCASS